MVRLRSGVHALTGLWILAGLVVMGINGYFLMSLFSAPLSGYSDGVRNVNGGLLQYRVLLYGEAEKITAGMDLLANRFTTKITVEAEKPAPVNPPAPRPPKKRLTPPPVVLPILTGIIMRRSTNGTSSRLALMDNKVCSEGARLGDFTVKRIGARGVFVTRGDQRWFLKAPESAFSLTTH